MDSASGNQQASDTMDLKQLEQGKEELSEVLVKEFPAAARRSSAPTSQTWTTGFEGDVFHCSACGKGWSHALDVDQDGVRVENQFYLDPEHKVAQKILQYAAAVARNFSRAGIHRLHRHSGSYRNPLVISGLPKTGKSTVATTFLPALLRTYGFSDHTPLLSEGAMPPPPAEPSGIPWSLWPVNCLSFTRNEGKDGFLSSLLQHLILVAQRLGFDAAAEISHPYDASSPYHDIEQLLENLPNDRLHVISVDEAQCFFQLELAHGIVDPSEVREMRRSFKHLVAMAPPHIVWVFTGSLPSLLLANMAEAPLASHVLHLSSSVPDDVMVRAWSLLKRRSPSLPDRLLPTSFKHPAMLVFLCDEWLKPDRPRCDDAGMHFQRVLERKMLPQVAADFLALMMLTVAHNSYKYGSYFSVQGNVQTVDGEGVSHLQWLLKALDPYQGVLRSSVPRLYQDLLEPYIQPAGHVAATSTTSRYDEVVFVDCYLYQHLLKMVLTNDGKLRTSRFGADEPWAYWEMERLRQFGELVNIAGKDNFKGHEEVLELLHLMAEDLGANVTEQQWYQEVLTHHTTKKLLETKNLPPAAAGMTDIDAVQWGVAQLRHCLSHEVGSRTTQLDACRRNLGSFGGDMDYVRLKHMLKAANVKKPPAVKAMAMLVRRVEVRGRCSVPGTRRLLGRAV